MLKATRSLEVSVPKALELATMRLMAVVVVVMFY